MSVSRDAGAPKDDNTDALARGGGALRSKFPSPSVDRFPPGLLSTSEGLLPV